MLNLTVSAGAQCVVDGDCGLCEKCVATVCTFQTTSEDTKDECDNQVNQCLTGFCDGAGACGFEPAVHGVQNGGRCV